MSLFMCHQFLRHIGLMYAHSMIVNHAYQEPSQLPCSKHPLLPCFITGALSTQNIVA